MPPDRGAGGFSTSNAGRCILLAVYAIIFSISIFCIALRKQNKIAYFGDSHACLDIGYKHFVFGRLQLQIADRRLQTSNFRGSEKTLLLLFLCNALSCVCLLYV
jgi:hypothetical protein